MGGRGGFFGGDHLIFRKTKGGSVVTENPKGGITKNFARIQRGHHLNLLGKGRHGGGEGWQKSPNVIRGITSVK